MCLKLILKARKSALYIESRDYISLTDIGTKIEYGSDLIEKWLRNKNTIEF